MNEFEDLSLTPPAAQSVVGKPLFQIDENFFLSPAVAAVAATPKNIYWVRHAESCANIAYPGLEKMRHPSLTSLGITQAIKLGVNYINTKPANTFTMGYASPTARTIMTGLLSMRTYSLNNPGFQIKLIQYISEALNFAKGSDMQNMIISPIKIKLMIKLIKDWLEHFWLIEYDDYEFNQILKQIEQRSSSLDAAIRTTIMMHINNIKDRISLIRQNKTDLKGYIQLLAEDGSHKPQIKSILTDFKDYIHGNITALNSIIQDIFPEINLLKFNNNEFLRGPIINFTLYNDGTYSEINHAYYKNGFPPFNKFYRSILDQNNIICFSHGSALKNHFAQHWRHIDNRILHHDKLINTAVFKEDDANIVAEYPLVDEIRNTCFDDNKLNRVIQKISEIDIPEPVVVQPVSKPSFYNTPLSFLTSTVTSAATAVGLSGSSKQPAAAVGQESFIDPRTRMSNITMNFDNLPTLIGQLKKVSTLQGGSNTSQPNSKFYQDKYLKYKNKYIQLKNNK